jgi:hypothetical protein
MAYYVTFETFEPKAAAIEPITTPKGYDLDGTLVRACELIGEDRGNVAISDGDGHQITGADLVACCNGTKKLTADLRAISN